MNVQWLQTALNQRVFTLSPQRHSPLCIAYQSCSIKLLILIYILSSLKSFRVSCWEYIWNVDFKYFILLLNIDNSSCESHLRHVLHKHLTGMINIMFYFLHFRHVTQFVCILYFCMWSINLYMYLKTANTNHFSVFLSLSLVSAVQRMFSINADQSAHTCTKCRSVCAHLYQMPISLRTPVPANQKIKYLCS
jgi:hypothetical protein